MNIFVDVPHKCANGAATVLSLHTRPDQTKIINNHSEY